MISLDLGTIFCYALTFNGYREFEDFEVLADLANSRRAEYEKTGQWRGSLRELRGILFFEQRRARHNSSASNEGLEAIQKLFQAICDRLDVGERVPNSVCEDGWLDEWQVSVDGKPGKLISDPQASSGPFLVAMDEGGQIVSLDNDPRRT